MFIEVTKIGQYNYSAKMLINTDSIVCIRSHADNGTIIETTKDVFIVEESYDELKGMITRIPVIVNTGTGEIDQLYEDADEGICSNHCVEPLKAKLPEKVDWSKLSEKISLIDVHEKSPYDSQVEEIYDSMSDEEKEKLHEFSLKILRSTGIPLKYLTGRDEI